MSILLNHPDMWRKILPIKTAQSHKYTHGHAVIYGAPELTGATRLAAQACARMGAGLVSVLADPSVANIYRASLPAHILVRDDLSWSDPRVTAKLYGPGGMPATPDYESQIPIILDADSLSDLPKKLTPNFILTPHAAEFQRAFPDLEGSRIERAEQATQRINAHIILKGAETVIAAPDGRICVNNHAVPDLATAGTGDVLAGMVTGLTTQNMPPFEASCAAVWIHSECAQRFGKGLVASDLVEIIPAVLKTLT